MEIDDRLADKALVIRCGRPPFDPIKLQGSCALHVGYFGFSVQCRSELTLADLAGWCPNRMIGLTNVGAIRELGYDVVVTPGGGHHATVVVNSAWTLADSERLGGLFQAETNHWSRTSP